MADLVPDDQRAFAREVVQRLRAKGFRAYWAGGCVRDQLLGREPKDYDVATDATPDEIRAVFGRRRTRAIGAAFGVVAVIGPATAGVVEVATFRRDAAYSDGRHPDAVVYSTPEDDARRRDFTINGLFYDPLDGQVHDFVGGRDDLARGIVRAIGPARQRFAEDKLRLLRAVRFAAYFGYQIEEATAAAIREMAEQVTIVSAERIAQEMRLMLTMPSRRRAVELLLETRLLAAVLPEVLPMQGLPQHKPANPQGDLWDHTLSVLALLREPSFTLSLAALLHDVGKPKTASQVGDRWTFYDHETVGAGIAGSVCRRWRLSRREEGRVCWLVKHHMYLGEARALRWSKLQRMLVADGIEELLDLHEADALASTGDVSQIDYCRRLLARPAEELRPHPLLNGHDLIRHGVPQGKRYHDLLEQVYDAQLEQRIRTKREALALVDRLLAGQSSGETEQPQEGEGRGPGRWAPPSDRHTPSEPTE